MDYLLDTSILLTYFRKTKYSLYIDEKYSPLSTENMSILSVVSIGEMRSIGLKNNWGETKLEHLDRIVNKFIIADINVESIINRYAEIDAFSQGKLSGRPTRFTSRNIGKNDLWIAATASVLNVKLLTLDKDFVHLDGEFIDLELVTIQ